MEKKQTKRSSKKYVVLLLAALLCILVGRQITRAALENDNDTSVRSVHVSDSEIEVSTLVIGSHLIHIRGLTETLYSIALDSANTFSQDKLYYKSELANGQWFEITDASSISDISTDGTLVDQSVIEALEFTHKTDADGVTTDLRTGQTVNIFDIKSPYDLSGMEELEPIRLRYETLQAKSSDGRTGSDEKYINMIRELFAADLRSEDCITCDEYLAALERYRQDLNDRDASASWMDTLDGVSSAVDAARRVLVYEQLQALLEDLLNRAQGLASTAASDGSADGGQEADNSLVVNDDIVSAIGDSMNQVESSLSAYEAKLLEEGTTVISKSRYDKTNDLAVCAVANDYSSCDTDLSRLVALNNIVEDKIVDVTAELELLESELVPKTRSDYEAALKAGASDDYVKAMVQGAAAAVGEQYLKAQRAEVDALCQDYQAMLDAEWKRMSNEDAQADALKLLDSLSLLTDSVQMDDAYQSMQESIDSQKLWLLDSYASLVAEAGVSSDMDALTEELADLQQQYQDALDRNDLAEASLAEAQIQAVQADIDALETDYLAILNSPNSSESDKAKATAGLGDGTSASAINQLASDFLNALSEAGSGSTVDAGADDADTQQLLNELEHILAALEELTPLNPAAAASAVSGISDALSGSTALPDSAQADLQASVADLQTQAGQALDNSNGTTMSAAAAKELLDSVLENLFGTDYDSAGDARRAEALLAMEWFGEQTGNQNIAAYAASLANSQAEGNSPYIYKKYTQETGTYLSLHAVGNILKYRTIFDNVHQVETLSKGMEYYTFTNGQRAYGMTGSASKLMERAAGLQERQLYITAADAKKIFSLEAEPIDLAGYAAAYTKDMGSEAEEILKALQEGGGSNG
jgi:hypothetical protein